MNIPFRLNRSQPVQINLAFLFALLVKLSAALPSLTRPADELSARRYADNKYHGEID